MVTIVARGVDPKTIMRTASCHTCDTVVEFNLLDSLVAIMPDERNGSYARMLCPVCGDYIHKTIA